MHPFCQPIFTDLSAEVNGLKLKAVLRAKLLQPGKNVCLQRVALRLQVAKRRTDEDASYGAGNGAL